MNFEQASQALDNGKLVFRKAWPTGTVLVKQGGYKADLEKWSDRSPLTKAALASLGTTESLEIRAHLDIFQKGVLECGYQVTRDDVIATDWEVHEVPVQQEAEENTTMLMGTEAGDKVITSDANASQQPLGDEKQPGSEQGTSEFKGTQEEWEQLRKENSSTQNLSSGLESKGLGETQKDSEVPTSEKYVSEQPKVEEKVQETTQSSNESTDNNSQPGGDNSGQDQPS